MNIDIVKDEEGEDRMIFDSSELYDDSIMGDKLSDFEILQILGKGGFGLVAKVRSIPNQKIYAMKKIDLSALGDEKEKQLCKNEITFLQSLSHPHINKYYKYFQENNCLYIFMEFMNNGDINGFIKAHKILNQHAKEEVLWNIFLQSMSSLTYIHKNGLIHRDIKPGNLFMTNDKIIKLGDFGVSALIKKEGDNYLKKQTKLGNQLQKNPELYTSGTVVGTPVFMAPEMLKNLKYEQKVDVYSMGCTFFEMCFFHPPRVPTPVIGDDGFPNVELVPMNKEEDKKVQYSKELIDIINLMLEVDPNKRPDSFQIYEMIKKEYTKKYVQNSSISAIIRCMYSFKDLTNSFMDPKLNITEKKPISFAYLKSLNVLRNQNFNNWNNSLNDFRQILGTENNKLEGSKEVDPRFMLAFLIEKIHRELNTAGNNNNLIEQKHIFDLGENVDKTNKNEMLIKFANNFRNNFNSIMSNYFFGMMKTKKICQVESCKIGTYTFNSFCFIKFEFEKMFQNISVPQSFNLLDGFNYQKEHYNVQNVYCKKCLDKKPHNIFKQFYSMPLMLVISINRGIHNHYNIPVNIIENLDISEYIEFQYSPKKYQLTGVISRIEENGKEHYICYNQDPMNKKWYFSDGEKVSEIDSFSMIKNELVIMLFYQSTTN